MHADLLRLVCCCFIAVASSLVGERAGAQANCSLKYRRRACTMITPAIRHPYDQWRRQDFVTGGEVRYGSIGGLEYEVPQKLTHLLQCIVP